jgi:hypothetical protein
MHAEHVPDAQPASPPSPPSPPQPPTTPRSPIDDELAAVREAVSKVAPQTAAGEIGATQSADGRVRIVDRDGRVVVLDPKLIDRDELQAMVQQAIAPAPRDDPIDRGPPENAIILTAIVMFFIALTLIGFPMARAAARRMDRRTAGPQLPNDLLPRLERIEQAVDGVALEMERVAEAQRFSARLLSERLPEALPRLDAIAAEGAQRRRLEG